MATLSDPWNTIAATAFRFEGLPYYDVPSSNPRFAEYLRVGRIDPLVETEWSRQVRDYVARGVSVQRLRAVSDPMSDYEAFEVVGGGYGAGILAGEEIRTVSRSLVDYDGPDFWLFDSEIVCEIEYDAHGTFIAQHMRRTDDSILMIMQELKALFANASIVQRPSGARR